VICDHTYSSTLSGIQLYRGRRWRLFMTTFGTPLSILFTGSGKKENTWRLF